MAYRGPVIMPTTRLMADLRLLGREFAAMRPATDAERRQVKARWRDVIYAIVFRSCIDVKVIVARAAGAKSALPDTLIDSLVTDLSRKHGMPKSAALFAMTRTLFPEVSGFLAGMMPHAERCRDCNCMWMAGGPLDPGSAMHARIEDEAAGARERAAA